MVGGNKITLNDDYAGTVAQMALAIDAARNRVHVQFYIGVHDEATAPFFEALARARGRGVDEATAPFFKALARARGRGVEVKVLLDHLASLMYPRRRETAAFLESIGAQVHHMLPLRPWRGQWQRPDLRNQRKILVVDSSTGFTGSINLIEARHHKA